jgi:hypothetical protein
MMPGESLNMDLSRQEKNRNQKPISGNSTRVRAVISGSVRTAANRHYGAIENSAHKASRKITANVEVENKCSGKESCI